MMISRQIEDVFISVFTPNYPVFTLVFTLNKYNDEQIENNREEAPRTIQGADRDGYREELWHPS